MNPLLKKPSFEICVPPQRNSVAMHSPDLCDVGSSGVTGVQGESNGALKELVIQTTNRNIAVGGNQCISIEPDDSVMDADKIVWLKMYFLKLTLLSVK